MHRPRRAAGLLCVALVVAGCGSASASRGPSPARTTISATTAPATPRAAVPVVVPSVDDAREAALRWVASTGPLLAMGPIARSLLLRRLVAPDAVDAMAANLDRDLGRLSDRLSIPASELRLLETPITADVTLTDNGHAAARVWSVVCFGAASLGGPQMVWRTSSLTFEWSAGRWLLQAFTTSEGPTPLAGDTLPATWDDFSVVAAWPPAVEAVS